MLFLPEHPEGASASESPAKSEPYTQRLNQPLTHLNQFPSALNQFCSGERDSGRGTDWMSSGGGSGGASPRGLP
jgi:hypothetical protein